MLHQADAGIGIRDFDLAFELLWVPKVIGVDKGDVFPARKCDAMIACSRLSLVLLVYIAYAGPVTILQYPSGIIG